MMETFDMALVDWSRAQFALTAMFHWIFVPLTLGITFLIAIMETIYVRTGDLKWKKITKFWMNVFGINFAIGVATGIILEFEFGTNWSNYSWFVGDIFGAPLAIEGIMAFFMESTFIAIMFFGWNKVSKGFHLTATWLTAIGSNLSALWILVANAWMQNPVGMRFNPDTARNEMMNFWDVALSSTAINKFLHTITSSYVVAAVFVLGISAWFLLKNRHVIEAKRSMVVASVFGLIFSLFTVASGDESAREVARVQPMKFAAMEGLYDGQTNAPLVMIGFLQDDPHPDHPDKQKFAFEIKIPNVLSYMAFLDANAFIPGIKDLVHGNEERGLISGQEKIRRGKMAIQALSDYKKAQEEGDLETEAKLKSLFEDEEWVDQHFKYFGHGYFDDPHQAVPHVPIAFYSFHTMVMLGGWFVALFMLSLWFIFKNKITQYKWYLYAALWTIPLVYIASQSGWVLAEMGRQPWVIQDLMPTMTAVTHINTTSVMTTFFLFLATFSILLIAEIRIMVRQIKKGPEEIGGHA
jgi:cytochrome d ubiquinol oxidase subunit I